ncbi:50S ribosomal protein L11 methyltransferase [Bordetella genomosp. 5]|uniref:SAM-dependent methyltransferase n=1 Tax=Bordetella genomosp. 5 TaxID=1395608 RepID=A0A261TZ31_9BORD|nr:50S ribosomal protein L11 methyltransferase [Bordetella genomosp. 5]OZI54889.1 SAM-dependent methyltransferase [Bordetella genomosp. 5]
MQVLTHTKNRMFPGLKLALLGTAAALIALPVAAQAENPPRWVELDVPYVPTPDGAVAKMLEMGEVGPRDTVIDLGSGDGRIAIAAVRDRGAQTAMGVDIDPARVKEANANARKAKVEGRVTFKKQDLFKTDISKASVLTMYLLPDVNLKMRPVILDKLAPGSRVVSHAFTMGEWESDRREMVDGRSLYLWIVPAKAAGTWQVQSPEGAFSLTLQQQFQKVQASAERDGKALPVSAATLRGPELRFTLDDGGKPRQFVGMIEGDRMLARSGDGLQADWQATRQAR